MFCTSQQCYFERIYWKPALEPFFYLGKVFQSYLWVYFWGENTFTILFLLSLPHLLFVSSQSCWLLLFLTLALPPPAVPLTPQVLLSLSWPLAVVSVFSSSPFKLLLLFSTLSWFLYFSLQAICLSFPFIAFIFWYWEWNGLYSQWFHWEYKPRPNIFQKYLEVPGGCVFIPGLTFSLRLWGIFVTSTSLVVSCRASQHMHPHLLWAVLI